MPTTVLAPEFAELELLTIPVLLLIASLVAIGAAYLRLPYTVALVVVGLFVGFGDAFEVPLSRDLILLVFLPPLLFEGAINMDLDELRERWRQVGVLALVGTLLAAAVMALGLAAVTDLSLELAVVLAVMLAPTDPVSTLAIFKEAGVAHGLRTLLEGESIFNDALGIVLFTIAVDVAFPEGGNEVTFQEGIFEFGSEVVIGVAVGIAFGFVAHQLMRQLEDHLVEVTLSTALAFGAFLVADLIGGSGVIAVVAGGLLIGNYGHHLAMSPAARVVLLQFWEVVAFLINSALFLLIGLQFDIGSLAEGPTLLVVAVIVVTMLAGRAVIAYGLLRPFDGDGHAGLVPLRWRHAVFWGGLRGSIPIALVLGLTLDQREMNGVDATAAVFGVVLFSLLVQGLSFGPFLRWLGLTEEDADWERFELQVGETLALRASLDAIEELHDGGGLAQPLYRELRTRAQRDLDAATARLGALATSLESIRTRQAQQAARRIDAARRAALADAVRRGLLSDEAARKLTERLELAALAPEESSE